VESQTAPRGDFSDAPRRSRHNCLMLRTMLRYYVSPRARREGERQFTATPVGRRGACAAAANARRCCPLRRSAGARTQAFGGRLRTCKQCARPRGRRRRAAEGAVREQVCRHAHRGSARVVWQLERPRLIWAHIRDPQGRSWYHMTRQNLCSKIDVRLSGLITLVKM
jgi:hypothetical protein